MSTNGTSVAQAAPARTSRIGNVKRGVMKEPLRALIYGPPGVGKTTLAAHAPAPIWLDVEGGSGELDVARYEFRDEADGTIPRSFTEVLSAVDDLIVAPHNYQTIV